MKRPELKHPDWTDKQCPSCGVTLTKQESAAGQCIVCKKKIKEIHAR